jgi:hypothetical protein
VNGAVMNDSSVNEIKIHVNLKLREHVEMKLMNVMDETWMRVQKKQ